MTQENKTRWPLVWPDGWPRTVAHQRRDAPFFSSSRRYQGSDVPSRQVRGRHSMEDATHALSSEIERMGGTQAILSTNVELRLDGLPYSNRAKPTDPGAAVYFKFKGREVSLACDKWDRVEDNVWAIAKHIEALRGQERWGVGTLEQAFRGYMALPGIGESSGIQWWKVLGVPINSTRDQVKEAYRLLAKKHHPDTVNGSRELWDWIDQAMRQFEAVQPR